MKYLKVFIQKGSNGFIYPPGYEQEVGRYSIDHLYYDEEMNTRLVLCIPDKDFSQEMIRPNIVEISEAEIKIISEKFEKRSIIKTDEGKIDQIDLKIRTIQLKQSLGIPLSETEKKGLTIDDEKALDPDDPMPGFNRHKILIDRIDEKKSEGIV